MGSLIPDERDHGETFKLLSCTLHASGVLLLDETSKKYLGADADRGDSDSDVQWNGQRSGPSQMSDPVAALNFDDVADDFFMDNGGNDTDDNGDDGGPANDYGDADFGYDDDAGGAPVENGDDGDHATVSDEDGDANRHESSAANEDVSAPRARRRDELDPWAPLDPYDASNATSRPFRKGRSYPKPKKSKKKKKGEEDDDDQQANGLDDPQFKERFLYGAGRPQWTSWVWSETNERALERKFSKKFCKAPLLVKSCDELWKLEAKWRSLVRRRAVKDEQSAQAMLLQEQAEEEEEAQLHALGGVTMANGVSALDLDLNAAPDDDDDDDDGGAPDDYDDSGGAAFDTGDWDAHYDKTERDGDDSGAPMSSQYFDTAFGKDAASANTGPMSYEDICRQHIQSFMQGTEKYVRETNLSKQVNDWQSKLTPILKEQDAHPPFDIHTYGRDIIGHLASESKIKAEEQLTPKRKAAAISTDADDVEIDADSAAPIPFGEIVGGMSQYQVCRMFLASLQLANNGNVALVHGHSAAEQSHVPFQMKLLSTSNVYESIQQQQS